MSHFRSFRARAPLKNSASARANTFGRAKKETTTTKVHHRSRRRPHESGFSLSLSPPPPPRESCQARSAARELQKQRPSLSLSLSKHPKFKLCLPPASCARINMILIFAPFQAESLRQIEIKLRKIAVSRLSLAGPAELAARTKVLARPPAGPNPSDKVRRREQQINLPNWIGGAAAAAASSSSSTSAAAAAKPVK